MRKAKVPSCYAQDIAEKVQEKLEEQAGNDEKQSVNQIIFHFHPGAGRELFQDVKQALKDLQNKKELLKQEEKQRKKLATHAAWEKLGESSTSSSKPKPQQLHLFGNKT